MAAPLLILCLHGLGEPTAAIPDDERPYWMSETLFADLAARAPGWSKARGVDLLFTFDDGNRSDLTLAAPILARSGLTAAFFPCTGRIGREGYLDEADLRELVSMGFDVGSHGVDHLRWATLGGDGLRHEVVDSRRRLEDALGRPVTEAAIPFGSYNRTVLSGLRAAGYRTAYTSDRGLAGRRSWRKRRWTYSTREPFDLDRLLAASRAPAFRLVTSLKSLAKGLR
jgi:peptidoglycan/xylan/chitin deacetylase (PgdA/CDA1 family)